MFSLPGARVQFLGSILGPGTKIPKLQGVATKKKKKKKTAKDKNTSVTHVSTSQSSLHKQVNALN